MISVYRVVDGAGDEVTATVSASVAERWSRRGFRVTAETRRRL
jgi:hypothetical protein